MWDCQWIVPLQAFALPWITLSKYCIEHFSKTAQVQFLLNEHLNKQSLLEAIDKIPYEYGITNTAEALKVLRTTVFRPSAGDRKLVPDIAVLITDGITNVNVRNMHKQAVRAKRSGTSFWPSFLVCDWLFLSHDLLFFSIVDHWFSKSWPRWFCD